MPRDPQDELAEVNSEIIELKERLKELAKRRKKIDLGRDWGVKKC